MKHSIIDTNGLRHFKDALSALNVVDKYSKSLMNEIMIELDIMIESTYDIDNKSPNIIEVDSDTFLDMVSKNVKAEHAKNNLSNQLVDFFNIMSIDDTPLMTEKYLSAQIGKDDARTLLYSLRHLINTVGLDAGAIEQDAHEIRDRLATYKYHVKFITDDDRSKFVTDIKKMNDVLPDGDNIIKTRYPTEWVINPRHRQYESSGEYKRKANECLIDIVGNSFNKQIAQLIDDYNGSIGSPLRITYNHWE